MQRRLAASAVIATLMGVAAGACGGSSPGAPTGTPPGPPGTSSPCSAIGATPIAATAIVNGTACASSSSSVVRVEFTDKNGHDAGACSGTVIGARAVLTAGHCVVDSAAARVSLGTGATRAVVSLAVHDAYKADRSSPLDLGVVIVRDPLPRSPVPVLFSRQARTGEAAIIAGWGLDEHQSGDALHAALTTIAGVSDFLESDFSAADGSVCQGDSGGALLLAQNGAWTLGGVISSGSTSACDSGKSYYAIVGSDAARQFILSVAPDAVVR
ncbi:MAG TPA: trypsin-like serine protease [Gemmatimonadaceae bacterium]|nr:trypsin-like serine protease [Vicinamibacterales bacterium]